MVFKAEDNDPFVNLADLVSMRITVVAPAPQNLSVVANWKCHERFMEPIYLYRS